jgi:hypothetical protein
VVGVVALVGLVGGFLFKPVIRPWYLRWGASDAEVQMALPGDDVLAGSSVVQATRAVDVHAPASHVWPWLVQMGQGRGGLYSYDWLENLAGCDIHNLDTIDPGLQNLRVGDTIKLGPQQGLPYYVVILMDAPRALVLRSVNPATGQPGSTWGFYLLERGDGLTRLVIRHRDAPSQDSTEAAVNAVFEPISFVMEQRMLRTLRDNAEGLGN